MSDKDTETVSEETEAVSEAPKVFIDPVDKHKHWEEATILELKMKKSRCKAAFTRAQNTLKDEIFTAEQLYSSSQ